MTNAFGYDDAAKRISDTVNTAAVSYPFIQLCNSWMWFRLSDGTTDNELYDSWADARRYAPEKALIVCLREAPAGMPIREAQGFLDYARKVYDAGARLPSPDEPAAIRPITPLTREDFNRELRTISRRQFDQFVRKAREALQ